MSIYSTAIVYVRIMDLVLYSDSYLVCLLAESWIDALIF